MRPGIISWLAVVPLSVALVSATVAQPGEAKAKHKHHHAACSKMSCENGKDLLSVAKKEGNLTIFLGDVKTAGLCCTLCGKGPYTVFAESDSVFHGLPKGASGIGGEKADVEKTIKYHIVKGNLSAADLSGKRSVTTLEGESLMIDSKDGKVSVDGALITKPDIKASNGVIHVVDTVLAPTRGK